VKKSWILLAGAALGLSSCVVTGNVEVFSAFSPRAAAVACTSNGSVRELNLGFTYTGTLKGLNFAFTPNQKPPVYVSIPDLSSPPAGFRIDTFTAGDAKLYVNLEQIATTNSATPQAVPQPDPKTSYPMTIEIEALGKTTDAKIKMSPIKNVDVADCYPPKPVP
jgi:hypothetical protein